MDPRGDESFSVERRSGAFQLSTDLGPCVKEDEIKANKNHIKEYYSLTAISLQPPVSS